MRTADKIALAKVAYRFVSFARGVVGKTDRCTIVRGKNRLELDLSEGVDFAAYLGIYERSTKNALRRLVKAGTNVLDIGANVGIHTVHLARLVGANGQVFAFEPTLFAFAKLLRNLEINPDLRDRVIAERFFLGRTDSEPVPAAVYSSWPLAGSYGLHPRHLGKPMITDGAPCRTLDGYLAEQGNPHIAVVKLDVDGYEADVLAGATRMMQRDRPIFVMEIAPYVLEEHGTSVRDLMAYFSPLEYEFFDERNAKPLEIDKVAPALKEGASINVVARSARTPT